MTRKLPARPNLEHLRTQAKALLSRLKHGEDETIQIFIKHLPAAARMSPAQVRQAGFRLADAQSAIARKAGFSTWPSLVHHVDQLRQLEGTWEFVDLEIDGAPAPAAAMTNSRLFIDGDRFRTESPEAVYEGIFTIDVERTPHQIDIEFVEGPEAGNWSYGIFEVAGDKFKLCIGLTGAPRPHGFATSPGSGHALENLRRASRARPEGVEGGQPQPVSQPVPVDEAGFQAGFKMDEMTPILARLQGHWIPVQLIQDGKALPEMLLPMGVRSTSGNEVKVVFGGQSMVHVKMRIDETQSPIAVDYLNVGRFSKGQLSHGIMEWSDDEIRICMAAPGQPRPPDFSCEPGSGRTLSRWKRK